MRIVAVIVGLVLVLGCSRASQTSTNAPVQLTPEMFQGYEFTLISKKDYCKLSFIYPGSVDATFGQINGAVAGLAYGWKVRDGNTLVFLGVPGLEGSANPERDTMQFTSFSNDIVVTTDGSKYKRTKFIYPN